MKTAPELRAKAARMREFALGVTDAAGALEAIQEMIEDGALRAIARRMRRADLQSAQLPPASP